MYIFLLKIVFFNVFEKKIVNNTKTLINVFINHNTPCTYMYVDFVVWMLLCFGMSRSFFCGRTSIVSCIIPDLDQTY